MATTNLDSADLKAATSGGLIREDVMDKIWDISSIPLPFTDRAGSGSHDNAYFEWTQDKLADPSLTNAVLDGADRDTINNTALGNRIGNHSQISTKVVQVSSRADASDTIGRAREKSYQIMMRLRELKRDVEAISLTGQASIADDGSAVPGKTAGVFAFCSTTLNMGATGAIPGFQAGTKVITAITQGTKRAGSEKIVRDLCQAVYKLGGDPSVFMMTPEGVRGFSEYCFTANARIATMTEDVGTSKTASTAKGAVNVFVTDFGVTLDLIPNRLQPYPAAGVTNGLIAGFEVIDLSYLRGYQTEDLAKKGLSTASMMSVDWGLRVGNDDALACYGDIDTAIPWVA